MWNEEQIEGCLKTGDENEIAIVESYNSKSMEAGFWKVHIRHLDVQFVAAGEKGRGENQEMTHSQMF